MNASLDWVDSLPSEVRALVHDYGEQAVRACWEFRITDPDQIRDLITSCRQEQRQAVRPRSIHRDGLRELLLSEVNRAGGVNAFARRSGVSNCLVSRTISGLAAPNEAIANALGLVVVTRFEQVRP